MSTPTIRTSLLFAAATLACLAAAGCHVDTHKNGNNDNVSISTPFGGMHVNTLDGTGTIGLTAYPGATPLKDDNGKDNDKSADVNLSFGDFHLGVKATAFKTTDAPDKVLAFYRKDLARYGDVLECQNDKPVGQPTHTSQGLTCSDKYDASHTITSDKEGLHINGSTSSDAGLELRAGSPQHQHIVGIDKKDGYTKIGLVLLDLPTHLGDHDGKTVE